MYFNWVWETDFSLLMSGSKKRVAWFSIFVYKTSAVFKTFLQAASYLRPKPVKKTRSAAGTTAVVDSLTLLLTAPDHWHKSAFCNVFKRRKTCEMTLYAPCVRETARARRGGLWWQPKEQFRLDWKKQSTYIHRYTLKTKTSTSKKEGKGTVPWV